MAEPGGSCYTDIVTRRFTAVIERDPESGLFIGIVPGLPGARTQGKSLDELNANLKEVIQLCLEESDGAAEIPEVVGTRLIGIEA